MHCPRWAQGLHFPAALENGTHDEERKDAGEDPEKQRWAFFSRAARPWFAHAYRYCVLCLSSRLLECGKIIQILHQPLSSASWFPFMTTGPPSRHVSSPWPSKRILPNSKSSSWTMAVAARLPN